MATGPDRWSRRHEASMALLAPVRARRYLAVAGLVPARVEDAGMTWTIQKPIREGWYWIRNSAVEGWQSDAGPCIVYVYGFDDGTPTVTLPSEETCSDLSAVDVEWAEPLEPPPPGVSLLFVATVNTRNR